MISEAPGRPSRERVSIVGGGRVGTTLGFLLARAGYRIRGVSCLRLAQAEEAVRFIGEGTPFAADAAVVMDSTLLLITTPDEAIATVARALAEAPVSWGSRLVLHCSGFHSSDLLLPLRRQGALTASAHPLQAVASPREAVKALRRCFFFIEGDPQALPGVEAMVEAIGARTLRLDPARKVLYHAAAVIASNYVVALAGLAVDLLTRSGVREQEALESLLPLLQGTLANLRGLGVRGALTGPISRGDLGTVRGHLEALSRSGGKAEEVYRLLGLAAVDLTLGGRRGLTLDQAWELREILTSREDGEPFPA